MDLFSSGFVEILAAEQTPDSTAWFRRHGRCGPQGAPALRGARRRLLPDPGRRSSLPDELRRAARRAPRAARPTSPSPRCRRRRQTPPAMGIFTFDRSGQISAFEEKPNADAAGADEDEPARRARPVLQVRRRRSRSSPRWASTCSRARCCSSCSTQEGNDFGRQLIPAALSRYRVSAYLIRGYWADVGTVDSFYDANILLTQPACAVQLLRSDLSRSTRTSASCRRRGCWARICATRWSPTAAYLDSCERRRLGRRHPQHHAQRRENPPLGAARRRLLRARKQRRIDAAQCRSASAPTSSSIA